MKKKTLIVLLSVTLAAVLCLCAVFFIFFPAVRTLKQADACYDAGEYADALNDYGKLLSDCQDHIYGKIGSFSDSAVQGIKKSLEQLAAGDDFASLKDHAVFTICADAAISEADAGEIEKYHIFAEALSLEKEGNYTEALSLLETLGDFTDTAKNLGEECEAQILLAQQNAEYAEALQAKDFAGARSIAEAMADEAQQAQCIAETAQLKAEELALMQAEKKNSLGAGAWYSALLKDGLALVGDERYQLDGSVEADAVYSGYFGLLLIKDGVPNFIGDNLGADNEISGMNDIVSASVGMNHALLVHQDGSVSAVGAKQYGKGDVSGWQDIVCTAAGAFHSIGVTKDGKVLATGLDLSGQCDTADWMDVTAVSAGMNHTVALKQDGTVVACGDNTYGQCDVENWSDVVSISCGMNFTVGLLSDGTVVACGDNSCGQCNVENWRDIVAVSAGCWHTAGAMLDGRLVACGADDQKQCDVSDLTLFDGRTEDGDAPEWTGSDAAEYVYIGDDYNGPWVYMSGSGAVSISLEDSYELVATRADLYCTNESTPEGILSGGGDSPRSTVPGTKLAQQNTAVFAINGDYFNFDYNPDGIQIRRGIVYKDEDSAVGFAFYPDGTMRIVDPQKTSSAELQSLGIRDSWVFGPTLILDGEVQDISWNPLSHNDVTLRSAIGSVCAYHHIAVSCGKGTLADLTQLFVDYGCTIAYNLDGGRSVWMTFLGKRVNRTYFDSYGTRNLADMVGFLHSDLVG